MSTDEDKNPDIDAVIRKIQKLLTRTKGDRGATEEESDTAMRIVQELMAKYNLDMATVDAAGAGPEDAASVRVDERLTSRARFRWQRELAKYVAEANFCLHVIFKDYKRDEDGCIIWGADGRRVKHPAHRFIGRKANVVTTKLMFDYLCAAVEGSVPVTDKSERFSRASSSWKEGCAAKVCERLAKRREDLMAEHDAKVRAAEEAFQAEAARRAKEAKGKAERTLGPRPPTTEEVAEGMKRGARVATGMKAGAPLSDPARPEVDPGDDWTPGDNAEPEPEVAPLVTTLVLASVYDEREQDLNEDLRFGREPGTTSRLKAKWEAARQARIKEYEEREVEETTAPEIIETPRQKEARERREAKEHEKNRRRWAREDEREWRREQKEHARRDHGAYRAGMKTGEKIGLDPQVKAKTSAPRLAGR